MPGRIARIVMHLFRRRTVEATWTGDGYHAFTTRHDRVVKADRIDDAIGPLSRRQAADFAAAEESFGKGLFDWRIRCGMAAIDTLSDVRRTIAADVLKDTVVTLLVDHSGSMRGSRILLAAALADLVTDMLLRLDVAVEVLGFTTRSWRGGLSRGDWIRDGRPHNPGRLCDLLHIVYREADGRGYRGYRSLFPMLRPDLLKENIDGEAIEWALGRLMSVQRSRKILIVVSDGAPVDDSTLSSNDDPSILVDHLKSVLSRAKEEGDVAIAAIGIGHAVDRYYERAVCVETPDEIGMSALSLVASCLMPPEGAASAQLEG